MSSRLVMVLRVLDLLQHRRSVSREVLVRETGATERTVYRLLRSLFEAGIPVHYDQETQGYGLDSPPRRTNLELTLQELTLAVFALDLLSEIVGPAYREMLVEARSRLIRCHPLDLGGIFCGHESIAAVDGVGGIDMALNSALVSTAIEASRAVEVDIEGEDGLSRHAVAAPSLVYKALEWLIVDKCSSKSLALSTARAIRIVSEAPA